MALSSLPPLPLPPPPRVEGRRGIEALSEEHSSGLSPSCDQAPATSSGPRGAAFGTDSTPCPAPDWDSPLELPLDVRDTLVADSITLPPCSIGVSDSVVSQSNVHLFDGEPVDTLFASPQSAMALDETSFCSVPEAATVVVSGKLEAELEFPRCQQETQDNFVMGALAHLEEQARIADITMRDLVQGLADAMVEITELREVVVSAHPHSGQSSCSPRWHDLRSEVMLADSETEEVSPLPAGSTIGITTPLPFLRRQLVEIRQALLSLEPSPISALHEDLHVVEQETDEHDMCVGRAGSPAAPSSSGSSSEQGEDSPVRGLLQSCVSQLAPPDIEAAGHRNLQGSPISAVVCTPPIAVRSSFSKVSNDLAQEPCEPEKQYHLHMEELARAAFVEQKLAIEGTLALALDEARAECQRAVGTELQRCIENAQESFQAAVVQQRERAETDAAALKHDLALQAMSIAQSGDRKNDEPPGSVGETPLLDDGVSTPPLNGGSKPRRKSRVRKLFCLCPSAQKDEV